METCNQNFSQLSFADAITALEQTDVQRDMLPYNANITATNAYHFISAHPCVLIDVRTDAEWNYVGIPDLEATQASFIPLSWVLYPDYAKNQQFETQLKAVIEQKDMPIFFLCKLGGRSSLAAQSAQTLGYDYCYNIAAGFEGDLNSHAQRGTVNGWKAEGLPWKQS